MTKRSYVVAALTGLCVCLTLAWTQDAPTPEYRDVLRGLVGQKVIMSNRQGSVWLHHPADNEATATVSAVGADFIELTEPDGSKVYVHIERVILRKSAAPLPAARQRADIQKARLDVAALKSTVDLYLLRSGSRELPTWEMLITPDARGTVWLEGYSEIPKDPWGNEYEMRPGDRGGRSYEILTWGPDGRPDTEDDISSRTIRR